MEKGINWKKWGLFLILAVSFISFETIYVLIGIDFENIDLTSFIILEVIKYLTFILILGIMYRKYLKEKWLDFRKHFKEYLGISFKDWFCGFLIMMVANIFITQFIKGLGENEASVQNLISKVPVFAVFMTTLFAPITEELIFRKSLQDCFKNSLVFMLVSGFIFGLVHVLGASNPYEYLLIISYGALGFMFARTLSKTDNIFCTIMMHMFHNGLLTLLALVAL